LRSYRGNRRGGCGFKRWGGEHRLAQVRDRFGEASTPRRLEYHGLEGCARQLVTAGLVQHEQAGAGKHLFERRAKERRLRRLTALTNILYWKRPVFDPDRAPPRLFRALYWIFPWRFLPLPVGPASAAAATGTLPFET